MDTLEVGAMWEDGSASSATSSAEPFFDFVRDTPKLSEICPKNSGEKKRQSPVVTSHTI